MELNAHVPEITGIPPHVDLLVQTKRVTEGVQGVREDIKLLRAGIKTVVHEAIDEKVASDGGVNAAILDKRLEAMEHKFVTIVKDLAEKAGGGGSSGTTGGASASGPVTADYFGY